MSSGIWNRLGYFRYHCVLYLANYWVAYIPSHLFRLWYYRRIMGFAIDQGASVLMEASFDASGNFSLGRNSTVNTKCRLDTRGKISIGSNVIIAVGVTILTSDHDVRQGWGTRTRA